MTADVEDLVGKTNDELKRDSFVWSDGISAYEVSSISKQIIDQLSTASYVAPDGKEGECHKKKARTAG